MHLLKRFILLFYRSDGFRQFTDRKIEIIPVSIAIGNVPLPVNQFEHYAKGSFRLIIASLKLFMLGVVHGKPGDINSALFVCDTFFFKRIFTQQRPLITCKRKSLLRLTIFLSQGYGSFQRKLDTGILERSTGSKFLEECLEVLISCGSMTIRSRQHKYREKTKYKVNCLHLVTMSKGLLIRRKDNANPQI